MSDANHRAPVDPVPQTGRVRRSGLVLLVAATVMAAASLPAQAQPLVERADDGLVVGLTVPWAIGGDRIEADGRLHRFPGEWPTVPFESIRLWDTRTAWLNLEPRNDQWDFSRLDLFVAKSRARGVSDISLVLGGTPRWAARQQRPTDAAWMGPGSASPPRRMSDWSDFVATVAARYRGVITSYEIWNEPNDVTFWSGTRAEWVRMVQAAATAIRAADPAAVVVASGFAMGSVRDVARVAPWVDALAGVRPAVDAVSIHWYPRTGDDLTAIAAVLRAMERRARAAGIAGQPWITEVNVRGGAELSAARQRDAVRALTDSARAGGAARMTWYAWTDLGPPDLIPLYPRTPAAGALAWQMRGDRA